MLVTDFDFELPDELIAQAPREDRAASRMLVLHRSTGMWEDRAFREFPSFLHPGDALVVNDSRVFPSRLYGVREAGTARVEVFLIRSVSDDERTWQALVRPGRKVRVGDAVQINHELIADVLDRGEHGERILRFRGSADLFEAFDRAGHTPLPPYIRRPDTDEDRTRYNTVFAANRGSVAAPTAGLHFTAEVLEACRAAGATLARVTLHVGLGTFAPLHAERLEDIRLHAERYSINPEDLKTVRSARRRFAVGTTTVRTLETVAATGHVRGETSIFIGPGHHFQLVDAMLTNFHLPRSSLLMLVSAFAGREFTLEAYRHAVRQQYRFFSYGDCMLIL